MDSREAKALSLYYLFTSLIVYFAIEVLYGDDLFTILSKSLPNAMAGVAALAASAWITLAVVEHALREDKRKLSEKVRDKTYFEIIDYVTGISQSACISIPCGLTEEEREKIKSKFETISKKTHNYKKEGKGAAEAIGELSILLNDAHLRIIEACGKASENQVEQYIEQIKLPYKDIKFDLDIYRTILLPRVFDFSENAELRDALIYFEITSLKYEKHMRSFDDPLYATKPVIQFFGSLRDLLNGAANVYWFIIDDLERNT